MGDVCVLVHDGWHTGELFEETASHIRAAGHKCYCPTLAGNRPGDDRSRTGLGDAVRSLVDFIKQEGLGEVRLVGHGYGGMVISKVVQIIPDKIKRLIYWNAFVPLNGESLNDLVPPHYVAMFDRIAAASKGALALPFEVWRDAFMNDADFALAKSSYEKLNLHPYKTFQDKISLDTELAELPVGKSFLNGTEDTALPQPLPWHPRLSGRLGLFRLVQCHGGHELLFTNPALLGKKIVEAGRD